MPGGATSILNAGFPVTIARLSTPSTRVPRILKSFGSFNLISVIAIGGMATAASEREAYVAVRLDGVCVTMPEPVVNSVAGTFQRFAAAAIIMARPAAPTLRIGV